VPTEPALHELARAAEGMQSIEGDVRDPEAIAAAVAQNRPEVVIHMAAQSLVRRSFVDPRETYATNVMGTVNVLDAVRRCGEQVRVLVNVTSDKCYENREWEWGYREDEPMGGHDPYSNSKGCAELVTSAFRRSFFSDPDGPRIASARAGNVIGGGDWGEDRLVPDIMRAALAGETVHIRNPNSIRPWQHVLNPLSGYLVLAQALWSDPERGDWPAGFPEDKRPTYSLKEIRHWLQVFAQRYYSFSQFKRSALPNGPKVSHGGSLSPRGDWRAPSDMSARTWLDEIEREIPED